MPRKPRAEFEITAQDKTRAVIRSVDRSLAGLANTARLGAGALGGLGIGVGITEVARLADRYNQLSTRIRTATKDTGDFESVQAQLLSTSISTGIALEETVETFQALSRVREDIGATNAQMLTLTETVQQLGVIGGASNEALGNGLRQFNQAIAAGVFRAEEFNSIVENTPELAKRIADGFGVTQGELRAMVIEGKLFADDVINVLLRQAPEIAAEFEAIPSNLDRAFTSLEVSVGSTFSLLDQKVGATQSLANTIDLLAQKIQVLSGTASPETLLKDQLDGLFLQRERLENELQKAAPGSRYFNDLRDQIDTIIARLEGTKEALRFVQSQGTGEVAGARPASDASATTPTPEALAQSRDRAAKHFEDLLNQEAEYLESQQELRLRGVRELAEAIAAEEEQLRADELARALGFDDAQAQARFEREEELFQARLEANERRFEDELAQQLGFEDARQQAIEDQEREHQQRLLEARFRFNRIASQQAKFLTDFEIAQGKQKTLVLLQEAQAVLQGVTGTSKAAFNIQKGLAIAEAVISAHGAAVAAWEKGMDIGGPPLAAAFAGLSYARTAAMIGAIQSTSFQGGASGASAGGGGGGGFIAQGSVRDIPVVSDTERNESRIRIEVTGGGDDFSRLVADNLKVSVEQGDGTLFSERSRQAIELRGS